MWPCRFALLKNVGLACSNYPVWPLQVTQGVFINDQLIIRKSAHSTQDTAKTGTATSPAPKITWVKVTSNCAYESASQSKPYLLVGAEYSRSGCVNPIQVTAVDFLLTSTTESLIGRHLLPYLMWSVP